MRKLKLRQVKSQFSKDTQYITKLRYVTQSPVLFSHGWLRIFDALLQRDGFVSGNQQKFQTIDPISLRIYK